MQERIQTTTTFALANLEKFTESALSGKRCDKIVKPLNFEEVHFLSVFEPVIKLLVILFLIIYSYGVMFLC